MRFKEAKGLSLESKLPYFIEYFEKELEAGLNEYLDKCPNSILEGVK